MSKVWQYKEYLVRPISPLDNPAMAAIIRSVMLEFGAGGPGFAIHDAEVDDMYGAYQGPMAHYYVIEKDGKLVGGAGFAPLVGGEPGLCELRKMYFLPELRGQGLAEILVRDLMEKARQAGCRRLYIETLESMTSAMRLYQKLGAEALPGPLGNTGHFSCDRFWIVDLQPVVSIAA